MIISRIESRWKFRRSKKGDGKVSRRNVVALSPWARSRIGVSDRADPSISNKCSNQLNGHDRFVRRTIQLLAVVFNLINSTRKLPRCQLLRIGFTNLFRVHGPERY